MKADACAIREMIRTASLGSPQNAVGFVMWRLTHRYQREVDQALRTEDLTHLQFVTLMLVAWLSRDGGSATQREVARFGDIHPMQVSNVLKALEQKEMIIRTREVGSGPAKAVVLTDQGLQRLRQALPLVIEVQYRLFGDDGRPGGSFLAALLRLEQGAAY